ncbi:Hsp20/alpha crystallin family protein [Paracoccus yeei]|jgi:HSP20 family molecular chaperone IbpA|uniref:Hsp20/alpha crystallin family protein n=1 Tax=Paracoccus yeei TaxID=147645 RepID=UPI003BF845E2
MSTDITQATEKTPTDAPETAAGGRIYHPLTDIVETDQCVSMMVEMPGVAADAVEIPLENRVLTIRGKVEPVRPENPALAYAQYGEGDFERAFTLSDNFDPDRIEAEMRGGVLTLTLPRAPEAQPKRIAVKGA